MLGEIGVIRYGIGLAAVIEVMAPGV